MNKLSKRRHQRKVTNSTNCVATNPESTGNQSECSAKPSYKPARGSRNAEGTSSQSSSVDHAVPQTPSPKAHEVCAIAADSDRDNDSQTDGTDPHFARLMKGLTLSATKLPAATADEDQTEPLLSGLQGTMPPVKTQSTLEDVSLSQRQSLTTNHRNNPIITSDQMNASRQDVDVDHTSQKPTSPRPERTMKHLALLESLASESARMASSPDSQSLSFAHELRYRGVPMHSTNRPGPSSSVPPIRADMSSLSNLQGSNNRGLVANGFAQLDTLNGAVPPFISTASHRKIDPCASQLHIRPMTSHSIHSDMMSQATNIASRRGANVSMHQGNLLNILGGQASLPFLPAPSQFVDAISAPALQPTRPFTNTTAPQMSRSSRVAPPYLMSVGPITSPGLAMPFVLGNLNPVNNSSDRMQLLSLLQVNPSPAKQSTNYA